MPLARSRRLAAILRGFALIVWTALPVRAATEEFHSWSPAPPMGWNSWNCFGTTVTESQTKAQADYMAEKLKPHGWEYVVVDIQWYEPKAEGYNYRRDAELVMDAHGRLLPAENRFPSAAGGKGFKPLADFVHGKGLKFGIHMMRGIPRQAVKANTPVLGSTARAADIAITTSTCSWNPDMYGVDARKPGGQAYYDSVIAQAAAWGVDYLKIDDLSRPYDEVQLAEVEAIRRAIDKTGRRILLSTSPGETPLERGEHVAAHANLWRISDDFWDDWKMLHAQFQRLHDWSPHRRPGAWPDADMLPIGVIALGRQTKFTRDEQITMMTLWCIAKSPLMHGGDMTKMDDFTLSLLTNDEVLAVNQRTTNNRQLFRTAEGDIAWVADVPGGSRKCLALFNTRDKETARVEADLRAIGLNGPVLTRDLWARRDLGKSEGIVAADVPPHGARLFLLTPEAGKP